MPKDLASSNRSELKQLREPPTLELELTDTQELSIRISGDLEPLAEASGHSGVAEGFVRQIAVLGSPGKRFDEEASSFALGFVDGMKPRDPAEVALVTQMAAIHQATMVMARRLNHVENIAQQDSAEKALNKLARTYAAQMEALKRYRSKGQQTVTVQHVNVEDGGQAIVGNVETGGRGSDGT